MLGRCAPMPELEQKNHRDVPRNRESAIKNPTRHHAEQSQLKHYFHCAASDADQIPAARKRIVPVHFLPGEKPAGCRFRSTPFFTAVQG